MGRSLGGKPGDCPVTEDIAERLIRLPLFADLTLAQQDRVIGEVQRFSPARKRASDVHAVRSAAHELEPIPGPGRSYLITVPAGARRLSATTFAAESAFVQHLRDLKSELGESFTEIVVAMAWLDDATYREHEATLDVIDEAAEGIRFVALHRYGCSKLEFAAQQPKLLPQIARLVGESDFVHSHFSYDVFRPIGAWFCFFARLAKKPVIAVDDIDRRDDAEMNYRTGRWSKRTYLMSKHVYDPARDLLQRAYVRNVDLMLFKEMGQVADYGQGAEHVRLFLDPNFSEEHIAGDAYVHAKLEALAEPDRPLRLFYFGRLVPYKGVDKMLEAVASARRRGANVTFDIMGSGEQAEALHRLAEELGIAALVQWLEPRSYGDAFFQALRERDVLLACPLSGDTPRSTWDALASAMPLIAFDTPFYKSMATISNAVELTPWPEVKPLADKLVTFSADKQLLSPMVRSAVLAARQNTGTSWLKRRVAWVKELVEGGKKLLAPLALAMNEWSDVVCALAELA